MAWGYFTPPPVAGIRVKLSYPADVGHILTWLDLTLANSKRQKKMRSHVTNLSFFFFVVFFVVFLFLYFVFIILLMWKVKTHLFHRSILLRCGDPWSSLLIATLKTTTQSIKCWFVDQQPELAVDCNVFPCTVSVRLAQGVHTRRSYRGRVEVLYNGTWGTVSAQGFTNNAAYVVCKMLDEWFVSLQLHSSVVIHLLTLRSRIEYNHCSRL